MFSPFFLRGFLRQVILGVSMVFFLSGTSLASVDKISQDPAQAFCAVYITGIGCSNCAATSPIILTEWTKEYPNLIIFEYEVYKDREANAKVKDSYFQSYLPNQRPGIPLLIINERQTAVGKYKVLDLRKILESTPFNPFPLPYGSSLPLTKLDFPSLEGNVRIWTKDRVLFHDTGTKADDALLLRLLLEKDVSAVLKTADYAKAAPRAVAIPGGEILFKHAAKIGDWTVQWNEGSTAAPETPSAQSGQYLFGLVLVLVLLVIMFSLFRLRKTSKGAPVKFELKTRLRDCVIAGVSFTALAVFFLLAKNISPAFLEDIGYQLPLPVFTAIIGLVDGFNPCNMFVLTCMLALLISSSESRLRLYVVAFSFVAMVFLFYFLFMAAWLNVFKYISFIKPLRIAIGLISIAAGIINCKELFFFKKGISLTIPESQKGPLMKRMEAMKDIIRNGSLPLLISSSLALAVLSSLVEVPCTAGFPIIYTGILVGKGMQNTAYYLYLVFYNVLYVVPLLAIVSVFIYTFRARQITQRQMEIIKFIGGIIMLLLGALLLVNPGLLGLTI